MISLTLNQSLTNPNQSSILGLVNNVQNTQFVVSNHFSVLLPIYKDLLHISPNMMALLLLLEVVLMLLIGYIIWILSLLDILVVLDVMCIRDSIVRIKEWHLWLDLLWKDCWASIEMPRLLLLDIVLVVLWLHCVHLIWNNCLVKLIIFILSVSQE